MHKILLALCALATSLCACTTTSLPGFIHIPAAGVSVYLPQSGWEHLTDETPITEGATFAQYMDKNTQHTAVLSIKLEHPPRTTFADMNDFYNYMAESFKSQRKAVYPDMVLDVVPAYGKAKLCVMMHSSQLTSDEKKAPGRTMTLEGYELFCQHPYQPKLFVMMHYSEREIARPVPSRVRERAEEIFANIRFEEKRVL